MFAGGGKWEEFTFDSIPRRGRDMAGVGVPAVRLKNLTVVDPACLP